RYGIQNDLFLEITRTTAYTYSDVDGDRTFSVNNKNALLTMIPEAVSGKTCFTAGAGYCYVCAASSEGRTFIIALLGCGWPPNKSWKWSDVDALTDYGKENYHYVRAEMDTSALTPVRITEGTQETAGL